MQVETIQTNNQQGEAGSPELLTVREACVRLRISKTMLYDLIRAKQLASIRIGRRRLIPMQAVEALVQQLSREAV